MGQKIHPTGFRLGITQEHRSRWYADPKNYPDTLQEDHKIRQYVKATLANAGISQIRVERKAEQIDLEVRTARPGVVVGRGGAGIDSLRVGLQKLLGSNRQIRINVVEVTKVDTDAMLIRAQKAGVEGIKIQVSGRVNGAEIARTEVTREGSVPLHTLRANIDYAYCTAKTIYGILGIKIWVFKGEIIPGQEEIANAKVNQPKRRQQKRRQQYDDRSNEG